MRSTYSSELQKSYSPQPWIDDSVRKPFRAGLSLITPGRDRYPDEWADEERVLPVGSAEPGPFRSSRTPYMIPIQRCIQDSGYKKVIAVMGSQMAKTEAMTSLMGCRLDDDPMPMLYVAPTKSFCEKVFNPRFVSMVDNCESLSSKRRPGKKEQMTQKYIAGVKTRFAWAGSPTELAGDSACWVFVDERDRMDSSVGGEGDPVELADARHDTYADGQTIVFSTPTVGSVEPKNIGGLEFWGDAEDCGSPTWQLFSQGTQFHWSVPCPECGEYFIPRFSLLTWPQDSSPTEARNSSTLACPHCGSLIEQKHKDSILNAGVFVAPGQIVTPDGDVKGKPPESSIASFWVSGLMSPWKTWGERAERFLNAVRDGAPDKIQAVINTGFGELFAVAGDAPDFDVIYSLKTAYSLGSLPVGVKKITMGVDVQQDRLYYEIRGWGVDQESWQLGHGELMGSISNDQVWKDLGLFRDMSFAGKPIDRCFIDSGFKAEIVYAFCRGFRSWAFPVKGTSAPSAPPLKKSTVDVNSKGKASKSGLSLWIVRSDHFKEWLHERFERDPSLPGGWHLAEDTGDDFIESMRSEGKVVKPSGREVWVELKRDKNHYLDATVYAQAAAWSLNIQMLRSERAKNVTKSKPKTRKRKPSGGGWFNS